MEKDEAIRILAIFSKQSQNRKYKDCTYLAKDTSIDSIIQFDELRDKIDTE